MGMTGVPAWGHAESTVSAIHGPNSPDSPGGGIIVIAIVIII